MRSFTSLLKSARNAIRGADGPSSAAALADQLDTGRLCRDGVSFWAAVDARPNEVRRAMYRRHALVSRTYVDRYLDQIFTEHRPNPMAPLYIESELGAPARQLALLKELARVGINVAGRRCLDIGCSNGSLLLAARRKGAAQCVGVDVSEGRIASARQLCEGSEIEFMVGDLASTDLPTAWGPFHLMFCTDVLEHVGSIPGTLAAMAHHLAPGREGRVFVTVFNHLNAGCVKSEPHYGVPGMVLVDRDAAAEIWRSLRTQLNSTLDYEVESWPDYASLQAMAAAAGLRMTPHLDRSAVLRSRPPFWTGYRKRLADLRNASTVKLEALDMSAPHRALLQNAIERYCAEAEESHRRFEADLQAASDDDVIGFHLRYYAQPLRFFLSHG